jgi:hypothetical protein
MRRTARVDANQAEVAMALKAVGATVLSLAGIGAGCPDLLVGRVMRCPRCQSAVPQNQLLEIKCGVNRLTASQREFHTLWRGPIQIARSIPEALRAVGIEEAT